MPEDKRVTWAELFFDLVFVFAITQMSRLVHDDHSAAGVARAFIVFVPVYWAWVGATIHANTHDLESVVDRLGVFAVGLLGLFMALAVPSAYTDRGVLFGASYFGLRIVLALLVFRGVLRTAPVNSFSVALCVTGPLLLVGGVVDGSARVVLWGVAAVVDLAVPRLVRSRLRLVRFEPAHLPERFGLFLIIALGESVVSVGGVAATEAVTPSRLAAVAAAWVVACGLWWVYFVSAASAVRQALRTATVQTDVIRSVLSYGHLALVAGVIAVAVGLAEIVAHPRDNLRLDAAALLFGGAAVYLGTFVYTHRRMFRRTEYTRLGCAVACGLGVPVSMVLPGVAALFLLALFLVVVNVAEGAVRPPTGQTNSPVANPSVKDART